MTFSAVLIGVLSYIALRASASLGEWLLLFALGGFVWMLPAIHWRSDADLHSHVELTLQQASFLSMGYLSWMLVVTVVRDFVLLVALLAGAVSSAASGTAGRLAHETSGHWVFLMAGVFTLWGVLIARSGPRVREVKVRIENLPTKLEGAKIAQISDLHVGPTIGLKYVQRVVRLVESVQPDLTVLTGDIVDGNIENFRGSIEPFSNLAPRGRVYFAPGNHEYYWDIHHWLKEFSRLGIKNLLNQGEAVNVRGVKVWVGGVTDPAGGQSALGGAPSAKKASQGSESTEFKLLLSHRPDIADQAKASGFDLQLSGHTHGGQFFPWTIVVKFFHKYVSGLFQDGSLHIYVSPGTGTWGPPIRVGTTPELTCITLERA